MDVKLITETLAKMEQNLQGVESARQQVQQVSSAYNGVKAQLEGLSANIKGVSEDISDIITAIKQDQTALSNDYSKRTQKAFDKLDERIKTLQTSTDNIQKQFDDSCKSASLAFSQTTDISLRKMEEQFNATLKVLNDRALDEINSIASKIEAFDTAATQMRTSFEGETTRMGNNFNSKLSDSAKQHKPAEEMIVKEFKSETEKVSENFKASANKIVEKFESSFNEQETSFEHTKNELDSLLAQYKGQIDDFWNKMAAMLAPISESINKVGTKQDSLKTKIVSNADAIRNMKDSFIKQNDELKKQINVNRILLIITLLATLISIAVKFV